MAVKMSDRRLSITNFPMEVRIDTERAVRSQLQCKIQVPILIESQLPLEVRPPNNEPRIRQLVRVGEMEQLNQFCRRVLFQESEIDARPTNRRVRQGLQYLNCDILDLCQRRIRGHVYPQDQSHRISPKVDAIESKPKWTNRIAERDFDANFLGRREATCDPVRSEY